MTSKRNNLVAVIGAGPAGLYAAQHLAKAGIHTVVLNRDIKPGGLAEYGIYYTKYRMKRGLRKQFYKVLQMPNVDYFGNVTVGEGGDITLEELQELGVQAILATVGAQGTKWLGLPGEDLSGVYHAKDIVYHYNKLPPFSTEKFSIGNHVALIGVGNVMLDIARWLIRTLKVDTVTAIARRGPAEIKFDKKEMQAVFNNLDLDALDAEIKRVTPAMKAVNQDPTAAKDFIMSAKKRAKKSVSSSIFNLNFLASPARILGDENGQVCGLEADETILIPRNGDTKAKRTGEKRILDVDTVIFCIGDRVDDKFGLPVEWNEFVKNPDPVYPVNDISYEAYDPKLNKPVEGIFMAGWSREASSGLVGIARKDGKCGAKALIKYLDSLSPLEDQTAVLDTLQRRIKQIEKPLVTEEDLTTLIAIEKTVAEKQGLEDFKFGSNQEMLAKMGLT